MTHATQTNTSTLGNIALDEHTKHFFPEEYHNGSVETFFRSDLSESQEHVYAAREAVTLTDERVMVAQHFYLTKPQSTAPTSTFQAGDIFVVNDFYPTASRTLIVGRATRNFWLNEVFGQVTSPTQPHRFPLQSVGEASLARCHKDLHSGFGLLIGKHTHCLFIDLRGLFSQKAKRVTLDIAGENPLLLVGGWYKGSESTSKTKEWFIEYPDAAFHDEVDKIAGDVASHLHQLLRFYGLSDDERAREVFDCDMATVRRVLPVVRLALGCEMGMSGPLAAHGTLMFRPFISDRALGVPPCGAGQSVTMPAGLRRRRAQVFAALNCHMAVRSGGTTGATYWARHVGREWAAQFACESEVLDSLHEVVTTISRFDERLEECRAC